jgi:hypothetical protein
MLRYVTPQRGVGSTHPKDALYDEVYVPLTIAWSLEFDQCQQRHDLIAQAPRHALLSTLHDLNLLFHELVDACLDRLRGHEHMLAVVREHRQHVLWEGQMIPSPDADAEEIRAALAYKLKRNISMGAVEIVICLEAATAYCTESLRLSGGEVARVVLRSSQLPGSLALLHDAQEQHRLQVLTGEDGYLKYPDITFADVIIGGRYRIPASMIVASGSGDDLRLRFANNRALPGPFDSPTRRCPAHLVSFVRNGPVLNETLWRLLVEIYRLSGRFA